MSIPIDIEWAVKSLINPPPRQQINRLALFRTLIPWSEEEWRQRPLIIVRPS